MQIKQFEYVQEIAACKSITQAAKKLYISQQALSEALKLLEDELGFCIFVRSNKGVALTSAGEKLLQDLNVIMPMVERWKQFADEQQEKETVKIWVQYLLSDLLASEDFLKCLETSGTSEIEWETAAAKIIIERVRADEECLGILYLPQGHPVYRKLEMFMDDPQYSVQRLAETRLVIALRADDELAEKEILQYSDLKGRQMVSNRTFGMTANVQEIIKATEKEGYFLPYSVDVLSFVLQHKEAITLLPEISLKNNIHVKTGKIVIHYLENAGNHGIYLFCNQHACKAHPESVQKISDYFATGNYLL